MKFHQLSLGRSFRYGEEPYRKTAPLLGTHELTGEQRVIPRSAEVTSIPDDPELAAAIEWGASMLDAEAILAALNEYHSACMKGFSNLLDADQLKDANIILDEARMDFCRTLGFAPGMPKRSKGPAPNDGGVIR